MTQTESCHMAINDLFHGHVRNRNEDVSCYL
jgi:hypothetical protein